jgi:hypothetical protein
MEKRVTYNAVGTCIPSDASEMLHIEFLLALVEYYKMCFCCFPGFVCGGLDFPCLHFLAVENIGSVHAFHIVLDLCGIGGRNSNVPAQFLLLVDATCKFGEVGREVPLDAEDCGSLFAFKCCDNAPLVT